MYIVYVQASWMAGEKLCWQIGIATDLYNYRYCNESVWLVPGTYNDD